MKPSLLLVIPCYRESARLPRFLEDIRNVFAGDSSVAVLIVDDGSGDDEVQKLQALVEDNRKLWPGLQPLLCLPRNIGKGGAVYAGWQTSHGAEWLGFVDADGSVPAYEVKRLLGIARAAGPGGGAVFASRILMLGKTVRRHLHRHLLGRIYATLVSELLNVPVYDSQCGLKILPAQAFRAVESRLKTLGFAFDVDLLVALLDSGCQVREEPIDWQEVPGGKVRLLRDSWRMFREIFQTKRRRNAKS